MTARRVWTSTAGGGPPPARGRLRGVLVALVVALSVGTAAGAAGGLPATPAQELATAGSTGDTSFCGTTPITLGIVGGAGLDAWSRASYAAVRSEAAKCPNVSQIVLSGGDDPKTAAAVVDALVARGADALVVVPTGGPAELRALRRATARGVAVVPWGADPGGADGKDYVQYVDWNAAAAGTRWARWMVEALHGEGNVVFAGGPAGNTAGREQLASIVEVFAKHPRMKLLTGDATFGVTDRVGGTARKLGAALLVRYPKIDGVIASSGADALAILGAFQAVGRRLVATEGLEANGLSCLYDSLRRSEPRFQLATLSSRSWLGRIAARKAIAAAEGIANREPARITLPFADDTLHGRVGRCDRSVGPGFAWSDRLSPATVAKYGRPG